MRQPLIDRVTQYLERRGLSAKDRLRGCINLGRATSAQTAWGQLIVGVGLLGLAGCHDYRGEECRAFVISVNSRLEAIDKITKGTDPTRTVSPADMRRLSELYQDLANKTAASPMNTAELGKLRAEYHAMVLEASKLAARVAEALDAKDVEKAMKAHERFGQVVAKEDVLVGQVNAFCQSR